MNSGPLQLTGEQVDSFDDFLLRGTTNTLTALETVFELNIDCSDSSIEIAPLDNNENLKHIGNGSLYLVSSSIVGEISGSIVLLMRAEDFNCLSVAMKPVMCKLFMPSSNSDSDSSDVNGQQPEMSQDNVAIHMDETLYLKHMMDALAEMGNILIGLYSQSIYQVCGLNTHHSIPLVIKDPLQKTIQSVLAPAHGHEQHHLVVENEFYLAETSIKLWCIISPTDKSFWQMLSGIDRREGCDDNGCQRVEI